MANPLRDYTREYEYISPSAYAKEYSLTYASSRGDSAARKTAAKPTAKTERAPKTVPSKSPERIGVVKEDLRPKRTGAAKTAAREKTMTRKGLVKLLFSLMMIGVLLVGTVWTRAMATEIKYSINKINKANALLENDIAVVTVKIESANSIETVEEYASGELGMIYPAAGQCFYIDETREVPDNLVKTIREKAYN